MPGHDRAKQQTRQDACGFASLAKLLGLDRALLPQPEGRERRKERHTESDEEPRLCYGDYSRIDQEDLDAAIVACYEHTVDLEWQTGDIALLDNLKVMHGRRPFSGSRSILASLCTPISRPNLTS